MKGKVKFNLNFFASLFAAPVIMGALFKILHWPGAKEMLMVGMTCEAIIFIAMAFQPQYDEIDWSRAYPELLPENEPAVAGISVRSGGAGNSNALDRMLQEANVTPELVQNLGNGLRTFGDKVTAISNVANVSIDTNTLSESLKRGNDTVNQLIISYQKASSSLSEMAGATIDTKNYNEQVSNMVKNLSALNAVYEMELQETNNHLKSMSKYYANINETMQGFGETLSYSQVYRDEVAKLAKNLTSLNSVYGNMLSAMNVPKS
ncbi:type IX secretion system motor protein PorL/GldL [Solitalea koreensis]|uniref:Gliding motility-associated protein GldL n=1 Tax=Solitalea koreensis TaxID=543615 RepID=A0A521AUB4_9SPHI|nr:gliding motility protein GldL [Solitalea koreensis]SMO38423.1 gliding motility-associated protein GldL [Solitalea koreensis]